MGADAAAPAPAKAGMKTSTMLYIVGALVLLIIAGIAFYEYQYGLSCILTDPSPLPGVKNAGFCGKTQNAFNSSNGWISRAPALSKSTSVGSCASNCSNTPGCTGFTWNISENGCTLYKAPTGKADAIKAIVPDHNWISGLKMVSKASPWGS
jgi:hypothetical protein